MHKSTTTCFITLTLTIWNLTQKGKAAKAEHAAAHAEAEARALGEPVATAYLADLPEVAEAKAAFQAVFDKYAAGEVALPVAPVHEVPAVSILTHYTTSYCKAFVRA